MFYEKVFVERLNFLIASNKTTKQALANAINIKRQAVSQFANGNNLPSIPTLVAIADHFYVSLDYLTGRTDEPCYVEQYILKDEEHFTNDMLYNWLPTYYKEVALRRKNYTIETRLKIIWELKTSEILNKEPNPNVIKAIFSEADNAYSFAEFSDYVITKMGLDIPQCKRYGKSGFE